MYGSQFKGKLPFVMPLFGECNLYVWKSVILRIYQDS